MDINQGSTESRSTGHGPSLKLLTEYFHGAIRCHHWNRAAADGFDLRVSAGAQGSPQRQTLSRGPSRKFSGRQKAMSGPDRAGEASDNEALHRFGYAQQVMRDMG